MKLFYQPKRFPILTFFAIGAFMLFTPFTGWGQLSFTPTFGTPVEISGFPDQSCSGQIRGLTFTNTSDDVATIRNQVAQTLATIPVEDRIKVKYGQFYYFNFVQQRILAGPVFTPCGGCPSYMNIYTGEDGNVPSTANGWFSEEANPPAGYAQGNARVQFLKGTKDGFVCIPYIEVSAFGNIAKTNFIIPFVVEGPTNPNENIEFLDTIAEPQLPYLVLHAPPGDGSMSTFQENRTTCRTSSTNVASSNSNSANLAVKVGVAGSAGLFVTTDFEFSVTMSAGVSAGDMNIVTSENKTCVTVGQGFSTRELVGPDGGGDVFIGYGTDLALGIYDGLTINETTCEIEMGTQLAYVPVGDPRQFIYTKAAIEADIENLEAIVADSTNVGPQAANNAQNQIDVWNQVLAMNLANINATDNEVIASTSFSSGNSSTNESSISVVETNTIQYEHYLSFNAGLQAKIEVGGSGVSGGYEYKGSKKFGETQNQSANQARLLKYTLSDDDPGDIFYLSIERDPMYGTPIFKQEPNTRSSCPYQGGYQRDQPKLLFGDDSQELTLTDIPGGGEADFQIRICNDSDEDRTYHLKGNSNTNLNGLIIEGFGNNLFNTNDQGIQFVNVPANDCLNLATLTVKQGNTNILDYEDIELYLNVDCQPPNAPITSSIFLNAYFTGTSSVDNIDQADASMTVTPNPNQGLFQVDLEGLEGIGQLILYDIAGKPVYVQELEGNNTSFEVNQDGLAPGMYILTFKNETQRLNQKVMIGR